MALSNKEIIEAARLALGDIAVQVYDQRNEVTLIAPRDRIAEVLRRLRDHQATKMHQLMDVCGVDYPGRKPRFDVVYQLLSLHHNWRLSVIVSAGEGIPVPTAVEVYPSAGWFEREVYDLFGIPFFGHPDMRRILTDYGFEGHPLRRDFPLMGFTQVRYDDLNCCVAHEPVQLDQDYRAFDAVSPWRGLTDVQKRGR